MLEHVDREDHVQRDEAELSLEFLVAFVQLDHDRIVRPDRGVAAEYPFRHLRPFPRLHRFNPIAGAFRQGYDFISHPFTSPAPPASPQAVPRSTPCPSGRGDTRRTTDKAPSPGRWRHPSSDRTPSGCNRSA